MEENKIRLKSQTSQNSVNEDSFLKLNLESKQRILPVGNISNVINLGDQFDQERQNSPYYRFTGTFNTLFTNVLLNTSGNNSLQSFNEVKFRDGTFPIDRNTIQELTADEDLTYAEALENYLREDNGWFGFRDPDPANATLCTWVDLEPNREKFSMTPTNDTKNWEITLTYPAKLGNLEGDYNNILVRNGLLIVEVEETIISGRNMLIFTTAVKHGLTRGDTVQLKNLSSGNGRYTVIRLGKDNGDGKEYSFAVDIDSLVNIQIIENDVTKRARLVRIVAGMPSAYYIRVFKKINVRGDLGPVEIENDDYEIFPLAFSQTIYEDKVPKYVFNEDVDITDLKDNLGRPLSEIYLTVIKTSSNATFTRTKSGVKMPYNEVIEGDEQISDINRINGSNNSHDALEDDVKVQNQLFFGDVVEYNILELKEKILGDVYHSFNTVNRETPKTYPNTDFQTPPTTISLNPRHESYLYKPHHRIKIRNYSNYIEQGTASTLNKPSYAINLGDGRFIWRDLLPIGDNDGQENVLDYPFLNGCHYINSKFNLALGRQDPFGLYNLQSTEFPTDKSGKRLDDNIIVKRSQDVC